MDYDDIDYDESYSIRDIDNNWSNSNMDYEADSDSDSDMDDYNYNYNNNAKNWSLLTGDKINRQTNRHNNSFLDIINKKLESLKNDERSTIFTKVERKNDSFLDLYEKMKVLNSPLENGKEFEPHYRSSSKSVIDNRYNRQKDNSTRTDISISMIDNSKATDKAISIIYKDKEKDELKKETSQIEIMHEESKRQKTNNMKDGPAHERITRMEDKEMFKKGMVKEMIERMERQNSEELCRKLKTK
ncbi:uncharacterized protein LOC136062170 [Quercus suber]|uniref:uncharacterized protein LOC136062170 n=1 Tax=Quercus suber TaxID=58331 RepID=UPI0032DF2F93